MCDTVIDEHFRRSLGNNYMELFDKTTGATAGTSPTGAVPSVPVAVAPITAVVTKTAIKRVVKSPQPASAPVPVLVVKKEEVVVVEKEDSNVNFSVDDHFAKALGETWNKLKAGQRREVEREEEEAHGDDNSETEDDSGSEGEDNSGDSGESRNRNKRNCSKRLRTERRRD